MINQKRVTIETITIRSVDILAPWGTYPLEFKTEDEIRRYENDPDEYAAMHFGLSKIDYVEWISCDGGPRCGAVTKSGKLCNVARGRQQSQKTFFEQHRNFYCHVHGG